MVMANKRTRGSRGSPACTGGGSITAPITLPNTDANRTYNLDGLGNWKTSVYTPVGGSQTADQRNHNYVNEITQSVTNNLSPVTFVYDGASGASNGNLTNDGTFYYQYDAINRPIAITTVHGQLVGTYVYDALNRRVRKTVTNGGLTGNVPNGTTDYIYMGNQVMEESSTSNTPIRQFVWGTYIDECIQLTTLATLGPQSLPAGTYYLLQDLLYRAVALTNASGSITEAYDTDAYGKTLIFTAPGSDGVWFTDDDTQSSYGANEIIYCGYRYDPESELYYVRNRTYNPPLGRWLQRDPIGYQGGINLYEYVGGRVVTEVDPEGTAPTNKQCCGAKSNCCGPDVTAKLMALAAAVRNAWSGLSYWSKYWLAFQTTVNPFTALKAWDTSLVGSGIDAMPCHSGTGKCKDTVTVSGKCYWQPAVNYWLAGQIYDAFANTQASWAQNAALHFKGEVIFYTTGRGLLGDPIGQKQDWFFAGVWANPSIVTEPSEYGVCEACTAKATTLTWTWGWLSGSV